MLLVFPDAFYVLIGACFCSSVLCCIFTIILLCIFNLKWPVMHQKCLLCDVFLLPHISRASHILHHILVFCDVFTCVL